VDTIRHVGLLAGYWRGARAIKRGGAEAQTRGDRILGKMEWGQLRSKEGGGESKQRCGRDGVGL
jgi:hypothetical protein